MNVLDFLYITTFYSLNYSVQAPKFIYLSQSHCYISSFRNVKVVDANRLGLRRCAIDLNFS